MSEDLKWVSVATFCSGFEAEFAVQRLEAEGIVAVSRGNDIVGIFGPGFQGSTPKGVDVLVPSDAVDAARAVLDGEGEGEGEGDGEEDYFDKGDS